MLSPDAPICEVELVVFPDISLVFGLAKEACGTCLNCVARNKQHKEALA
jgi:7-cyano-7-deazaguanine synthase in queuosine biosynthesis